MEIEMIKKADKYHKKTLNPYWDFQVIWPALGTIEFLHKEFSLTIAIPNFEILYPEYEEEYNTKCNI
jgi:hypothetical protein